MEECSLVVSGVGLETKRNTPKTDYPRLLCPRISLGVAPRVAP